MISHLGSLILISGIALTIAAPHYRHHEPEEEYRRHGKPEKVPEAHHRRYQEPEKEPEERHEIHEKPKEHHRRHEEQVKEPEERHEIHEEPGEHHRRHEEPVRAHHHGDIQEGPIINYGSINNYFEEPPRDTGYETVYLEPPRDTVHETVYLEPPRDTVHETVYLVEPYEPTYLVPVYPQVYDREYEYDYYSVWYDSLLPEGLSSSELLEGPFGLESSSISDSVNPQNSDHVSSHSSSSSSSSSSEEPGKHTTAKFQYHDFFKDDNELAGSQPLNSSFEQDFVSPVVSPPPFFEEMKSKSEPRPSSSSDSNSNFSSEAFFDHEDSYFGSSSDYKNPEPSKPTQPSSGKPNKSEKEPSFEDDSYNSGKD